MLWFFIAIAVYLAWASGVLTLGTSIGLVIGGGTLGIKRAMKVTSLFVIIGALFLSHRIIGSLGGKLAVLTTEGILSIMISVGILVFIFSMIGFPVSTTYLFIGSMLGYSLVAGIKFNYFLFIEMLFALVLTPTLSGLWGWWNYKFTIQASKIKSMIEREKKEEKYMIYSFLAMCLLGIALGANQGGVVMSLLMGKLPNLTLGAIAAVGMILGLFMWGYKTARNVGIKLTDLSPMRSFSAQIGAAVVSLIFITMGLPVSITQALLGGTIGVGLARGKVSWHLLKDIGISWGICFPAAIGLGALLGVLL
jgi:PiT family inorganic phosphate transporter